MKDMLDKIVQIEKKYNELGETLSDPAVIKDYNKFRDLSKQRKSMEETVELYYAWKKATDAIEEAKQLMYEEKDEEMRGFLKAEIEENEAKLPNYEEKMKVLLLPRDPMDDKDIMSAFSSLSTKGLIKLSVIKDSGKITEIVDISNTYKAMVSDINIKIKI